MSVPTQGAHRNGVRRVNTKWEAIGRRIQELGAPKRALRHCVATSPTMGWNIGTCSARKRLRLRPRLRRLNSADRRQHRISLERVAHRSGRLSVGAYVCVCLVGRTMILKSSLVAAPAGNSRSCSGGGWPALCAALWLCDPAPPPR